MKIKLNRVASMLLAGVFFSSPVLADQDIMKFTYDHMEKNPCAKMQLTPDTVKNIVINIDASPLLENPNDTVPILLQSTDGNLSFIKIPKFTAMGLSDYYAYLSRQSEVLINQKPYIMKYISIQSYKDEAHDIDENYTGILVLIKPNSTKKHPVSCRIYLQQEESP